ncbi:putative secreted lipase [Cladobotryum mycophilum]|uniref:Secreted lipase n=1 Tax=Cladobotryum mycophilum TaxID=491253 RepID=A0ABR0SK60_9HYPO
MANLGRGPPSWGAPFYSVPETHGAAERSNNDSAGTRWAREQQGNREAYHRRTTFYVNGEWQSSDNPDKPAYMTGQMYVEKLEPVHESEDLPIILIHDDFHTGQSFITKPDGKPGWATFFLNQGYTLYIPDLPYIGRSNYITPSLLQSVDLADQVQYMSAQVIERELTGPAKFEPRGWVRAALHDKFPGTGQRNDPIFDNYVAGLAPMIPRKPERETLAQQGLNALLKRTGKAILIGVGTGAVAAWLAADIQPESVDKVIAIEPTGPPFGVTYEERRGFRVYTPFVKHSNKLRPYGLSEIPLTYDPPANQEDFFNNVPPLPTEVCFRKDRKGSVVRQVGLGILNDDPDSSMGQQADINQKNNVRQLIQLKKMKHLMITSEASSHTTYDWQTLTFLRDAGVRVAWIPLEKGRIRGNGHLMFLETNSDRIASMIDEWIKREREAEEDEWSVVPPRAPANASSLSALSRPSASGGGSAAGGHNGQDNTQTGCLFNRGMATNNSAGHHQHRQIEQTRQGGGATQPPVDAQDIQQMGRLSHQGQQTMMHNPTQSFGISSTSGVTSHTQSPILDTDQGMTYGNLVPTGPFPTTAVAGNTITPNASGNMTYTRSTIQNGVQGTAYGNSVPTGPPPAAIASNGTNLNLAPSNATSNRTYRGVSTGNIAGSWDNARNVPFYQNNAFVNHGNAQEFPSPNKNETGFQSYGYQTGQEAIQHTSSFPGNVINDNNMAQNVLPWTEDNNQAVLNNHSANVESAFRQPPQNSANDRPPTSTPQLQQVGMYPSPSSFGPPSASGGGGSNARGYGHQAVQVTPTRRPRQLMEPMELCDGANSSNLSFQERLRQ